MRLGRFISQKELQEEYNDLSILYEGKGGMGALKQELINRGHHIEGDPFDPKRMLKNVPTSIWNETIILLEGPPQIVKALAPIIGIMSKANRGEASPDEIMQIPDILLSLPKGIGQALKDSYLGGERFTATLETNPMQVINDVVALTQGVAGGLKLSGKALAKTGAVKAGEVVGGFGKAAGKIANIGTQATTFPISTPASRFLAKKSIEFWGLDKHWNKKAIERFAEGLGGTSEKGKMSSLQEEMYHRTGRKNPYRPLVDHGIHGSLEEMEAWTKEISNATRGMKLDILQSIPGVHKSTAAEHLLEDFMTAFSPEFAHTMSGGQAKQILGKVGPGAKAQIMSQLKTATPDPVLPNKFQPIYAKVKDLYYKAIDEGLTLAEMDEARSLLDKNQIMQTWNEKGAEVGKSGVRVKADTPAERRAWGQDLRSELENLSEKGGFSKKAQAINVQIHGRPSDEVPTLRTINQQIRDMESWSLKFGEMKEVIRVATPIQRHPLVVMGVASSMFGAFMGAGRGTIGGVAAGLAGLSSYAIYSRLIKDPRFMSWLALRTARLTMQDRKALQGFIFEQLKPSDTVSRIFREIGQDAYKAFPTLKLMGRSLKKSRGASASFVPETTDSTQIPLPSAVQEKQPQKKWEGRQAEPMWKIESPQGIETFPSYEPESEKFNFRYRGQDSSAVNRLLKMLEEQQLEQ